MRPNIWLALNKALCLLLLALFSVACGAGDTGSNGSTNGAASNNNLNAPVVPTMPAARFTAVGQQSVMTQVASVTITDSITASIIVTTTEPVTAAAVATEGETAVNTVDLTRGANAYARNNCAECHGERGEGIPDKGKPIAGIALSETEFTNLLRTGGGLGNSHIFGPSAVSPGGMTILYAYVQSLQ